ncbi:MAG TPA: HNH endonuclease [Vicinamibacterales bacterium]|nr:HNH endonuclease [Vicinamibacterales bacterium]
MQAYVGVTDGDWYGFLRERRDLDEVNFWQPGGRRNFRALGPGQPFLFKLHSPDNVIAGGGFFAHFTRLPVSIAWEAFGERNGASSYAEMRRRVEKYRRVQPDPHEDYEIGCIILQEPFFFDRQHWLPAPADFAPTIVSGKTYDLTEGIGRQLWEQVVQARALQANRASEPRGGPMYGEATLIRPRLGQGAFRALVTDAYGRRCAVTGEKTLPVLEAAHIRPVSAGGEHRVDNGLLLRSDIHILFDRGYVTVTPDYRFRVSQRLRRDWQNGRVYYQLQGTELLVPGRSEHRPSRSELEWHGDVVFKG